MNPAHKRMNDFIRRRVILEQPTAPAPQIANANAGAGRQRPPAKPQSMTAIIRQAYYSNYKGTL
jgi:hypothetical protein